MQFDMDTTPASARYKLLTSTITPRPIAWVTTISGSGVVNVAPFSCFNLMGHTPPTIVLGIEPRTNGEAKDTVANIEGTGEMVINLVRWQDVETMVATSAEVPPEINEAAMAGVALLDSVRVLPPRIASAPVSFECRSLHSLKMGPMQTIIIGEILTMHITDDFIIDEGRWHVDTPALNLIGRMHGPGWYARCDDPVQFPPAG